MLSALTNPFVEAVEHRDERLGELHKYGEKILGYFCTYTPIEVIHAAGLLPVRVMSKPRAITKADSLVPDFICPYLRRALDKAMSNGYGFLSGIIQGYTCDVACGVMKIWEENIPGEIFHTMPIPYNKTSESRAFFRTAIAELISKLEKIGGAFSEDALDGSLDLYGEIRGLVLDLYGMRPNASFPLSAGDFHAVIQAGFVTPPEEYLDMLKELYTGIKKLEKPARTGVPVLVSGSLVEESRTLEILEESGGRVVADDLCTGFRHFQPALGNGPDSVERLIDRYMHRFPCPSRSRVVERLPLLIDLVQGSRAKGVVFLFQKFCTPHLADHPTLAAGLKDATIPSVAIEMEETGTNEGRLRTRLEAFVEMLRT